MLNFELNFCTRQTLYSVVIFIVLFHLTLVLSEVVWHLEMRLVSISWPLDYSSAFNIAKFEKLDQSTPVPAPFVISVPIPDVVCVLRMRPMKLNFMPTQHTLK